MTKTKVVVPATSHEEDSSARKTANGDDEDEQESIKVSSSISARKLMLRGVLPYHHHSSDRSNEQEAIRLSWDGSGGSGFVDQRLLSLAVLTTIDDKSNHPVDNSGQVGVEESKKLSRRGGGSASVLATHASDGRVEIWLSRDSGRGGWQWVKTAEADCTPSSARDFSSLLDGLQVKHSDNDGRLGKAVGSIIGAAGVDGATDAEGRAAATSDKISALCFVRLHGKLHLIVGSSHGRITLYTVPYRGSCSQHANGLQSAHAEGGIGRSSRDRHDASSSVEILNRVWTRLPFGDRNHCGIRSLSVTGGSIEGGGATRALHKRNLLILSTNSKLIVMPVAALEEMTFAVCRGAVSGAASRVDLPFLTHFNEVGDVSCVAALVDGVDGMSADSSLCDEYRHGGDTDDGNDDLNDNEVENGAAGSSGGANSHVEMSLGGLVRGADEEQEFLTLTAADNSWLERDAMRPAGVESDVPSSTFGAATRGPSSSLLSFGSAADGRNLKGSRFGESRYHHSDRAKVSFSSSSGGSGLDTRLRSKRHHLVNHNRKIQEGINDKLPASTTAEADIFTVDRESDQNGWRESSDAHPSIANSTNGASAFKTSNDGARRTARRLKLLVGGSRVFLQAHWSSATRGKRDVSSTREALRAAMREKLPALPAAAAAAAAGGGVVSSLFIFGMAAAAYTVSPIFGQTKEREADSAFVTPPSEEATAEMPDKDCSVSSGGLGVVVQSDADENSGQLMVAPFVLPPCHIDFKPSEVVFNDSKRVALHIVPCPWRNSRALVVDGLGRILLICTLNLRVLRIWKGYRQAEVAWLASSSSASSASAAANPYRNNSAHKLTGRLQKNAAPIELRTTPRGGILIYAPRRGLLELWDADGLARHDVAQVGHSCLLAKCTERGTAVLVSQPSGVVYCAHIS